MCKFSYLPTLHLVGILYDEYLSVINFLLSAMHVSVLVCVTVRLCLTALT